MINTVVTYGINEHPDWEEWFAWYPVKVKNVRVWGKKIYRRKYIYNIHTIPKNDITEVIGATYTWAYLNNLLELMTITDEEIYYWYKVDFSPIQSLSTRGASGYAGVGPRARNWTSSVPYKIETTP